MNDLKFSAEQQDAIWRMLAAILHLGELDFDKMSFDDLIAPTKPGKIKNEEKVEVIAELLGMKSPEALKKILLQSVTLVNKEEFWKPNSLKKCNDNKDALAKQAYNNMFNWLVKRMNVTIQPAEINEDSFADKSKTVGLLDIFGFENFKSNNFEQLCINYVNEKLHKLYIAAIFEAEKMELMQEGLTDKIDSIQYPDLKVMEVIKMLDYKQGSGRYSGVKFANPPGTGLFTLIDDACTQVIQGRQIKYEDVSDSFTREHKK